MRFENLATQFVTIQAPPERVWEALVDPRLIKKYMFGADVRSDWKEGSPIVWHGESEGKRFEGKGVIQRIVRERMIRYTHYRPSLGLPDRPENYHTVTVTLSDGPEGVNLALTQDNNPTEQARRHSEATWKKALNGLKHLLER